MAIPIECPFCRKPYSVSEKWAGKKVKCKECGHSIRVPAPGAEAVADVYGLADAGQSEWHPPTATAPLPPRLAPRYEPDPEPSPRPRKKPAARKSRERSSSTVAMLRGAAGTFGFLVIIGLRIFIRYEQAQARHHDRDVPAETAQVRQSGGVPLESNANGLDLSNWTPPAFAEPSPERELEPGVTVREIRINASREPGHRGKLWLYLPAGITLLARCPAC